LGVLVVNGCFGFRVLGSPNGPPSRQVKFQGLIGVDRGLGVLVVNV